jgi:hypothetical protein
MGLRVIAWLPDDARTMITARVCVLRGLLVTMVVSFAASGAFAQDQTGLRALLAAYRCPVVDRLERIYESGDPSVHVDRYLAVTVPEHPHGYVQCMFHDHNTKLLCEASSGFYFAKPGEPRTFRLRPEAIAALGRLGFSTDDSQGNFRVEIEVGAPPDFNLIADYILLGLHGGYGARADSALRFNAPFAPRESSSCKPVS